MSAMVQTLMDVAQADMDVLLMNDRHGDQFALPREVDFMLRAPSAEKADLVTNFINDFQYGNATTVHDDTGHSVRVLITMPITQHVLFCVSGFMACLAKLYNLEYDGWGSVIQTDK
jgi:hypothetical protein